MNTEAEGRQESVVNLEGDLTIQRANEWKEFLMAQIAPGKIIQLDIRSLRSIDIAGFQLLCSAHRTAKQGGGNIRIISDAPADIAAAARTAGFARIRGCGLNSNESCLWTLGELI
jgi:anti-anti-sigma factor